MRIAYFLLITALWSWPGSTSNVTIPPGNPIIEVVPAKAYGGARQVWDLAYDDAGQLYVATPAGVSVFDGARWRFTAMPKGGAFCLADAAVGDRLYYGGLGNLGYLKLSPSGLPEPHSLLELLPEDQREIGMIWQALCLEDAVYFRSSQAIFRYQGERLQRFEAGATMGRMFLLDGKLWTQRKGLGIHAFGAQGFGTQPLIQPHNLDLFYFFLGDWQGRRIGIALTDGLFEARAGRFERWPQFSAQLQVYSATITANHTLICGTTSEGLYLINPQGKVVRHLDTSNGLPNDTVITLELDRDGALWVGTQDGLARVSLHQPISQLGRSHGLTAAVEDLYRQGDTIFLASNEGLHRADLKADPIRFESLGLQDASWCLLATEDGLMVGGSRGAYLYGKNGLSGPYGTAAYTIQPRPGRPNAYWVGGSTGLFAVERSGDALSFGPSLIEGGDIRRLCQDADATLWAGTVFDGLYVIRGAGNDRPSVSHYPAKHFGTESFVLPYSYKGQVLLSTGAGLFRVTRTEPLSFQPIPVTDQDGPIDSLNLHCSDITENLYFTSNSKVLCGRLNGDGKITVGATAFGRLGQFDPVRLVRDQENLIWAVGAEGLTCFSTIEPWQPRLSKTLVRAYGLGEEQGTDRMRVPFEYRNPHFEAALPQYDATERHLYRFRLDPFDSDFTPWSESFKKDYTNLPPGRYVFTAQARDAHGITADPAFWEFRILPPWYRTYWAWALYILAAAALLYGFDRARAHRHRQRAQELEQQVTTRTAEVEHQRLLLAQQNQTLEQQNLRIQAQAEELADAARRQRDLFANLSHEFRTPLTLTLGPLEDLLAETDTPLPSQLRDPLSRMRRHAHQLLELINQLLDLARLDAKVMALRATPLELVAFLRQHVPLFDSLAASRQLQLRYHTELEKLWLMCDSAHLEKILNNLLANAIAATPPQGTVELELMADQEGAILLVRDSGRGMDAETLAHIFDRFYQGESRTGSSGIGLALAHELVTLHQGRITVQSTPGQGTLFTLHLPYGDLPAQPLALEQEASATPLLAAAAPLPMELVAEDSSEDPPYEVTVLIVEDHPEVRQYLQESLTGEWRLVTAERGDEGLERALELLPDLIVSDVMMPGMDGFALCQALKNDRRTDHIPVILLTARGDLESRLTGLEQGADDYLAKPFNRRELQLRVRNQLQSRRNLRSRFAQVGLVLEAPAVDLPPSADSLFVAQVDEVIAKHLGEADFGVAALADAVHLSARQLQRKLNAITGQGPLTRLRDARLAKAKLLLAARAGNVAEISYKVGYESPDYFAKQFRKVYGAPPSEYMG